MRIEVQVGGALGKSIQKTVWQNEHETCIDTSTDAHSPDALVLDLTEQSQHSIDTHLSRISAKSRVIAISRAHAVALTPTFGSEALTESQLSNHSEPLPSGHSLSDKAARIRRAEAGAPREKSKTCIVLPGIIYGGGELDEGFAALFYDAFFSTCAAPRFTGDGSNCVPTIHLHDLAALVVRACESCGHHSTLVASDGANESLAVLASTIAAGFGHTSQPASTDALHAVVCEDYNACNASSYAQDEHLLLHLPLEPSSWPEVQLQYPGGLTSHIGSAKDEFVHENSLAPIKVLVQSMHLETMEREAKALANAYGLPRLTPKELEEHVLPHVDSELRSQVESERSTNGALAMRSHIQLVHQAFYIAPYANVGFVLSGISLDTALCKALFTREVNVQPEPQKQQHQASETPESSQTPRSKPGSTQRDSAKSKSQQQTPRGTNAQRKKQAQQQAASLQAEETTEPQLEQVKDSSKWPSLAIFIRSRSLEQGDTTTGGSGGKKGDTKKNKQKNELSAEIDRLEQLEEYMRSFDSSTVLRVDDSNFEADAGSTTEGNATATEADALDREEQAEARTVLEEVMTRLGSPNENHRQAFFARLVDTAPIAEKTMQVDAEAGSGTAREEGQSERAIYADAEPTHQAESTEEDTELMQLAKEEVCMQKRREEREASDRCEAERHALTQRAMPELIPKVIATYGYSQWETNIHSVMEALVARL